MTGDDEAAGPQRSRQPTGRIGRARWALALPWLAVSAMVFLALIGVLIVDIVMRYGAGRPIDGGHELVEFMVVGLFAVALPAAAALHPRPGVPVVAIIAGLVEAGILLIFAYGLTLSDGARIPFDERSLQLGLPLAAIPIAIGVSLAVSALTGLLAAFVTPAEVGAGARA